MNAQNKRCRSWPPKAWPLPDQRIILVTPEDRPRDPFALASPAGAWAPATRRSILYMYKGWLGHLETVAPERLDLPPADRITPETVRLWLETLEGLAPTNVVGLVCRLLTVARVSDPSRDWSWLETALRRLRRGVHPVRKKKVVAPHEIWKAGLSLMSEARTDGGYTDSRRPKRLFNQYRDGLILALWAVTALRRGEFSALRISALLLMSGDSVRIEIPAHARKRTNIGLSIPLPERLVPYLQYYLAWRARLPSVAHHDALWVDALGRAVSWQALARALGLRTERALGISLSPHALRYSAATWIALNDPTHVNTAMAVLGHARLATTSGFYIMAQTVAAQQKVIANLRALHSAPPRTGRRKQASP